MKSPPRTFFAKKEESKTIKTTDWLGCGVFVYEWRCARAKNIVSHRNHGFNSLVSITGGTPLLCNPMARGRAKD